MVVDQLPFEGAFGAHALGGGGKNVREIAAHPALVHQPGQSAGAGQYAQQRHFRQGDGGGAVVDHDDLVAGQRDFVAAAGAGAIDRGEELEAGRGARFLDAVARLVGELAEVHLPGVAGQTEHIDVRARAEHPRLAAGQDHGPDFGMLEADALQGVGEFDVDAEIIGVQLQLVAGPDAAVFVDVEHQGGDGAVEFDLPVRVARGVGVVGDRGCAHCFSCGRWE